MLEWWNRKKLLYFLLIGILILIFSFLLWVTLPYFKEVFSFLWKLFLPFIIAGFIAYLLYPIIEFLDRQQIHKGLAVMIIYILFFGGIAFLFYRVYPIVIQQMNDLIENIPQFVNMYESSINHLYTSTSFLPETFHDKIDEVIIRLENLSDHLVSRLVDGFTHLFDMILIVTVIPVLVFYYIKDYHLLKQFLKGFIPHRLHSRIQQMVEKIDEGLGGYLRGLFFVSLFVTLLTFLAFKFIQVPYALLLAIVIGLTNIIPYFGPIIGAVPAVMIAYTTSPLLALYVIIAIFVVQMIDGNFLSPFIMGKNIRIHPVMIIFALLLGGQLFGIIGMIIAVPLVAILKVVVKHLPYLLPGDN